MKKTKKSITVPRWVYLTMSLLVTGESINGIRQTWIKYRWGDALGVPASELIQTGVVALLFTVLAAACWYLWATYYRRNHS